MFRPVCHMEPAVKEGLKNGAWDERELDVLRELQAKYAGRSEWAKNVADAWPLPRRVTETKCTTSGNSWRGGKKKSDNQGA